MTKYCCFSLLTFIMTFGIFFLIIFHVVNGEFFEKNSFDSTSFKSNSFVCRDSKGKPIDWTLSYKVPKLENNINAIIQKGAGFYYVTEKDDQYWSLSTESIDSNKSIIGETFSQIFKNKLDLLIIYNDQQPNSHVSSSLAHAKGILAISGDTGFYLMHSIPNFPNVHASTYNYPSSGYENGQNLLCISLSKNDPQTLNNIANHLLIMKPFINIAKIQPDFADEFPLFDNLKRKKWNKQEAKKIDSIYSIKRNEFTLFSKSNKFSVDIYASLVAPYMKNDIAVQSWRNGGGGKLSSDCKDEYKVMNVEELKIDKNADWKYTEDHSKWAISIEGNHICIGDLNRMKSQFNRGGGVLCLRSSNAWQLYHNLAVSIDTCPL